MHFSQFARYINENAKNLSAKTLREVKAEAIARYTERLQSGYADRELTFTDLFARCEKEAFGA